MTRPARTAPRRAYTMLLVLATLGGCGVPAETTPREIVTPAPRAASGVPPNVTPEAGAVTETLCFVRDGQLMPVTRRVRSWPTIETQLQHLVGGPTTPERAAGLTSALTGTTAITSITLAGGRVTLDLADDSGGSGRTDEILAYGQLVCTLGSRPDISGVSFRRDGRPLAVPRGDGSLTQGPLAVSDYLELMPR